MAAINPLRGEAELAVGELTFKLCFDVNAFCFAEQQLGKTTDEIVEQVAEEFSGWSTEEGGTPRINTVLTRALLWAGLQKHHPLHLAQAGEIMSDAGISPVVTAVLNGFFAAFGTAEDKKVPRPRKRDTRDAPGTG